jgi:parvulin-like peptidyl-prolyl isomerase
MLNVAALFAAAAPVFATAQEQVQRDELGVAFNHVYVVAPSRHSIS